MKHRNFLALLLCLSLLTQHFPQGTGAQAQYVACLNALVQQWEKPEV